MKLPVLNRRWLRVVLLIAIPLHVLFSATYTRIEGIESNATIAARYSNLLVPASYAFSIWGAIHAAFLAYACIASLPSQWSQHYHDRLAAPLLAAYALATLWLVAFGLDHVILALGILLAMLALGIAMYRRASRALELGRPRLLLAPFSLFLAWISVATFANVTITFVVRGVGGYSTGWGLIVLALVLGLAFVMATRFRDGVFPAVVAWAAFALAVSGYGASMLFTIAAAAVGTLTASIAVRISLLRRMEEDERLRASVRPAPRSEMQETAAV